MVGSESPVRDALDTLVLAAVENDARQSQRMVRGTDPSSIAGLIRRFERTFGRDEILGSIDRLALQGRVSLDPDYNKDTGIGEIYVKPTAPVVQNGGAPAAEAKIPLNLHPTDPDGETAAVSGPRIDPAPQLQGETVAPEL